MSEKLEKSFKLTSTSYLQKLKNISALHRRPQKMPIILNQKKTLNKSFAYISWNSSESTV